MEGWFLSVWSFSCDGVGNIASSKKIQRRNPASPRLDILDIMNTHLSILILLTFAFGTMDDFLALTQNLQGASRIRVFKITFLNVFQNAHLEH
jgi:hypothetical protein